ncbi:uncharacterized protein METZ01_LOCUS211512, partial [marine metagenome]
VTGGGAAHDVNKNNIATTNKLYIFN